MAGGPITVTDRISVRVTAKNQEQSNSQKRDVGGAIAKTLGNENVSDSLKDQLGNTKNPVITDENGDTWVSEEDLIDAGKTMNDAGAIHDKHNGMMIGNILCNIVNAVQVPSGSYEKNMGISYTHQSNIIHNDDVQVFGQVIYATDGGYWGSENSYVEITDTQSKETTGEVISTSTKRLDKNASGVTVYNIVIGDKTYYYWSKYHGWIADDGGDWGALGGTPALLDYTALDPDGNSANGNDIVGYFYGAIEQGGDIDWTKPDNEIDPQIHELFETMRTKEGKDYVKVAIATESSGESGSGDSGSGGGHTGGDF